MRLFKTIKVVTDYGKDIRHFCVKINMEGIRIRWSPSWWFTTTFKGGGVNVFIWFKTVNVVTDYGKDIHDFSVKIKHTHSWITFLMIYHHFNVFESINEWIKQRLKVYSGSPHWHVHFSVAIISYSRFPKPIDFEKQESCCIG